MTSADAWWAGRRICVTGGSGLIGRALLKCLSQYSVQVVVLGRRRHDDFSREVVFKTGDVRDPQAVEAAVAGSSVVFHLAADKRRQSSPADDLEAINVDGTRCLLQSCHAAGVESVIYASTAYVYELQDGAIRETHPAKPASRYASTKREGECLLEDHVRRGHLRGLIARIANVYGGGVEPDTVIGRGVLQGLNSTLMFRDLSPVRDFIHVRDVAEALVRLAPHASEACPIVNVGTGIGTSVLDVAEIIAGWASRRRQRPRIETDGASASGSGDRLVPDTTRLHQLTQWRPATTVAQGVSDALDQLYPAAAQSR